MARHKSPAQKKRESVTFGIFLIVAGLFAFAASVGLVQLVAQHGVVQGTIRGGNAMYVSPGSTEERSVVSWFHSSGREKLRDGDPVSVILYPGGGRASSKSPFRLALYCVLGGIGAIGLGYVFIRF